ncbi:hypothetical protein G5714_002469 [Onychostoma macrolepis]|uniref:Uncharacterized protein n=1 Tax=Onychostoma macrolepis TaxID=369639 RepID=A0A7J6DF18_9TELE|nr:hypothetical protein G5714_002469 [Onychostoma macrolepis]
MNENRYFTNEVTEAMQKAQKIIEERMQAETAERTRKIKEEVKKMADVRWRAFISDMNEETQDTERRRKRIQRRIDQIETDIKKEDHNVRPIPERVQRFRASLQKELENMGRLDERRMEEREEIKERKKKEQNDLDIWMQEEEQRRLSEGGQDNPFFSDYYVNMLTKLSMFLLGIGVSHAPALLLFLFPAAPAVEAGLSVKFLASLLGFGAAESGSFCARLRRFRASLQKELENMRKVKKKEIEEEAERKERRERKEEPENLGSRRDAEETE